MSVLPLLLTIAIGVPLLILVPALVLQVSCKIAGVEKRRVPGLLKAVFVAFFAGIASILFTAAWSCTFGLLLGLVFGKTVVTALSYLCSVTVAAVVYRGLLRLRLPRAFVVSVVAHVVGVVVAGIGWFVISWLPFF